jgi:7,8-dihydropterin-6-yl-methyl-4-(beta-D-ribofuranosyl)aminobenzene 5'-phosphate synthase
VGRIVPPPTEVDIFILALWEYSHNPTFMLYNCNRLQVLESVHVSLLVEDAARGAGILGEHGLCWCLRVGGKQLLMDLGQGLVLERNAGRMSVDLAATDAVVFSHGHYDHVGGWEVAADALASAKVFLHPDALEAKFQRRDDGRMVPAGLASFSAAVQSADVELVLSTEPCEVVSGIWMTGEVPRSNTIEDTGGDFYCGAQAADKDQLLDDQSLFFKTDQGIVVVLGCAHAGVVNTLHYISQLAGERIHAVLGGMHLLHASAERMSFTVDALRRIAPDWLGPNHCTGDAAVAQLWHAFPAQMLEMHAGQSYVFPIQNNDLMKGNDG